MTTMEAIRARRSYRGEYLNTPVPREHLHLILEAGMHAPSGCNKQTTSFIAVDDPEILAKLHRVFGRPLGETAPAVICVLTRKIIAYQDRMFHVQDYSAAIENMLLTIADLGYATCWIEGYVTEADRIGYQMQKILGVPDEYELVCYLPVGIPAGDFPPLRKRPFEMRGWLNGFGEQFTE